jgi:N-acetylmuramoyl-L-alanine amidase
LTAIHTDSIVTFNSPVLVFHIKNRDRSLRKHAPGRFFLIGEICMSTNPGPLESDSHTEGRKQKQPDASEHLHKDSLNGGTRELHKGDKHVQHMTIVDKHGESVERVHHVKKGETLSSIARHELKRHEKNPNEHQVSRFAHRIAHANDIKSPYHIHPGQELLIPKQRRHGNQDTVHYQREGRVSEHQMPRHERHAAESVKTGGADSTHHPHPKAPKAEAPAVPITGDAAAIQPRPATVNHDVVPVVKQQDAIPPAIRPDVRPDVQPDVQPVREGEQPVEGRGVLAGKVIVIDPGHGGQDTGATAGGVAEKSITPLYAGLLAQKLQAAGAKVIFTRPLEDDPRLQGGEAELHRRAALANAAHADVVVRIHANAPANKGDTSTHGLEAWWDQPKDQALTQDLHDAVIRADGSVGLTDHGMRQKTEHYKFQPQAPSALLELGYITNAQERGRLLDRSYQNRTTDAMVQGLVTYFNGRGH